MNKTFSPNIKKKIKIKGLNQEVSLNQFKKIIRNEKIFYANNLKSGFSTSCGCFRKEKIS